MTLATPGSDIKAALRQHLSKSCPDTELASWFDPLKIHLDTDAQQVHVSFPHGFFAQWFAATQQNRFEALLGDFLGNGFSVRYADNGTLAEPRAPLQSPPARSIDFPFDRQFLFETFLINKKNYFPLASAREVAKQSGSLFNPFIVCGHNGSGKTHLLRAIANEISKRVEAGRILMTSVDDLKTLYGVRFAGDIYKARTHIYEFDYLFVDDLHHLRKYPELQSELIVLFNHFFERKKQMAFSCLDKVSGYEFLDPNLLSRLEWGLIVTLKQPDLEVRVAYIQEKARLRKLALSKEQVLTLAQRFKDFRYLQGILLKLFAFKELVKKDLSKKDFVHILNNTEEQSTESLTPDTVMGMVADYYNLSVRELKGNKRHAHIAQARQVAMYLCRSLLSVSFPALGRVFGGKDHSTVLYSVKKIEQLKEDDADLKQVLRELKKKCLLYDKH
ncbi:MAG: DnaA/Hda family protein [Desulfovibrionaceae bacterium]